MGNNEIGKVIKFKPFSIFPDNLKSISLIFFENLRAQKGRKSKKMDFNAQPEVHFPKI